ncbi:MAG: polyribonucleotide nucleotidyltransferase [Verrucomicrobia bacterium]|nr:polyribonucleotide nucleotidyltransferase [Verrucomicrobiota bacterium]
MKNTKKIEVEVGSKTLTFESGALAQQAGGAVTVQLGETIVFSAVTAAKKPREGMDYFPLQVEYREKFYAAGRFPGGYFKREARPSEKEILISRATDRPIRPLFPKGYFNEVQIINSLMSADGENEAEALNINVASAALTISDIPFQGPIAAVKVGRIDGQFVVNPTHAEMAKSDINLLYVSTSELPVMIEGDAKEVPEADMVAAMKFGHEYTVKIIDAQLKLRAELGLPKKTVEVPEEDHALVDRMRDLIGGEIAEALTISGKQERHDKVNELKEKAKAALLEADPEMAENDFFHAFDDLEIEVVRNNILDKGVRIDGRGFDELRSLDAEVGLFPRTHGSAVFSRGETQALATITLGTISDAQSMDAVSGGADEKRFMLHYNFPPYSVGETGRIGFTGRREIGHGNLAERSLAPVLPDEYPYTVRIVSEIMGSNGSSSMASICVGTLALMDAGVKIKKPVAGISIGLVTGGDKAVLITDILGAEDHCGDMDFKVAGTRDGVTGFQVDLKLTGLRWDLVEGAFEKSRVARGKILDFMATVLADAREELSRHAPRIETLKINPDKIGALIGPGGKNIRRITDTHNVQIDIEDDGTVNIFSTDGESMAAAVAEVAMISAEAEEGKIYNGRVTGVKDFGAFVEILPGKEGLVHISELADFRVKTVEDICKVGDQMWVKCLSVEDNGKIRLSRRAALAEKDAESQE